MHHIKKYIKILSFIKNEGLKKFLLNVSHRITSKFLKMLYKSILKCLFCHKIKIIS